MTSTMTFDPAWLTLVAITDDLRDGTTGLAARAAAAVRGGATMVQVRLKDADARTMTEAARAVISAVAALHPLVPVVVNDRVDVALAAGAAGVHLGFDDLPVGAARRLGPPGFIVGASVGELAEVPSSREADYVGIGPVYPTATKADAGSAIGPAGFATLAAQVPLPAVGVGGISAENAAAVVAAGARGIAVVRAVFGARDVEAAARALRSVVDTALAGRS
jgi:thiamine-phosphate pyrophosphorylase